MDAGFKKIPEKKDIYELKKENSRITNHISELERNTQIEILDLKNSNLELNKKIEFILAEKKFVEEGYNFMKKR